MPNSATLSTLFGPQRRWNFPAINEDRSPEEPSGDPPRASRLARISIAAVIGLIALAVVISSLAVVWRGSATQELPVEEVTSAPPESPPASRAGPLEAEATLVVHVSGAVFAPGLVELEPGARVHDAITAAGGPLEDADTGAINLARLVVDAEHIVVPLEGETVNAPGASGSSGSSTLVSLSNADAGALDSLPGIGPVLASRIIAWREVNGPFHSVDDVLAVPGIGKSVLEGFRELVVP